MIDKNAGFSSKPSLTHLQVKIGFKDDFYTKALVFSEKIKSFL
jgi:hypothetical protein